MHIEGNLGGITAITKNTILFLEDLRGIKAVAKERQEYVDLSSSWGKGP